MSDGISFFNNDDIEKHIKFVTSQTNYTQDEAIMHLKQNNGDYIKVIRTFMGLPEKPKLMKIKSVNQEIFKQMRLKLDETSRLYREKNPINIDEVAQNFKESDIRQNMKKINN
jgi:hypothetical protein